MRSAARGNLLRRKLWTPADLGVDRLVGWYNADSYTWQSSFGSRQIDKLIDQSGRGNHWTAFGFAGSFPLISPNRASTGRTWIDMRPSASNRNSFTMGNIFSGASAGSMYVTLFKNQDPADGGAFSDATCIWDFGTDTVTDHFTYSDGNIYCGWGSTVRKSYGNPTPSLNAYRIISIHSEANSHKVYIDGTLFNSTGTNTVAFRTTPVFGANAAQNVWMAGAFGEVILTNFGDVTAVRQQIEGYLARQDRLNGNLPAGHPYKNTMPHIL
jgi:hypothetical protein